MSDALDALRRVDFDWVRTLDSIWIDAPPTGAPNEALVPALVADLRAEARTPDQRAKGRALVGQPGIGKTHLVGQLRREVWRQGGWFVPLDVLGLTDFWRSAALSFVTALLQAMPDGRRQSDAVLAGVARRFKVEAQVEAAFNTPNMDARRIVDVLVRALVRALLGEVARFEGAGGSAQRSGLAARTAEVCSTLGREVSVALPGGGVLRGTAEGLDGDGRLLVRPGDDDVVAVGAGDVVHVR